MCYWPSEESCNCVVKLQYGMGCTAGSPPRGAPWVTLNEPATSEILGVKDSVCVCVCARVCMCVFVGRLGEK